MSEVSIHRWFDELAYKRAQGSFSTKGAFILRKLAEHDAERLCDVLADLYRDLKPDPQDITKLEWEVILRYMGASEADIWHIQQRMGRQWR